MHKIRRNDMVQVITGKDRGKKGKVLRLFVNDGCAIVEGINLVKKHKRRTQQDQQAKITQVPLPIRISNLMLICKNCNKLTKVGFFIAADATKTRICRKCKQPV